MNRTVETGAVRVVKCSQCGVELTQEQQKSKTVVVTNSGIKQFCSQQHKNKFFSGRVVTGA